jgi:hypothetical protein
MIDHYRTFSSFCAVFRISVGRKRRLESQDAMKFAVLDAKRFISEPKAVTEQEKCR